MTLVKSLHSSEPSGPLGVLTGFSFYVSHTRSDT